MNNSHDALHLKEILTTTDPQKLEAFRAQAETLLLAECGTQVYFRGLIEFSNRCACDCLYCGIRASNAQVTPYTMSLSQIVDAARSSAEMRYGSVVLQSGERRDAAFIDFVEAAVNAIKNATRSSALPDGLGITLGIGEQSEETYRRLFKAGAHRYLLRIETTNRDLFKRLHPRNQVFDNRADALRSLKKVGFQVGTGVMIGLPGQTIDDLVRDLLFFKELDIDMIGMGPYIVHANTPMAIWPDASERIPQERFDLSLRMIAATRLFLKNVNIAATTALQAIDPEGREKALRWGANVMMPQLTPLEYRRDYQLYDGKPCLDDSADRCAEYLARRVVSAGRTVGFDKWGDSPHFQKSKALTGV